MSATNHLQPLQFNFHAGPTRTVEAWPTEQANTAWAKASPHERYVYTGSDVDPGHRPVGSISWSSETGEIQGVYVVKEHQRKGIASRLLDQARSVDPAVQHSSVRTASGRAWSEARP